MKYQEFTEEYENITNNDLLNKVLWFNGIKTKSEYQAIETNSFPFYFDNTEYFIDMINKHQNDKIIIVGDYDCDGVCATSIMLIFLKKLGIDCDYIIGNRFIDGYGMNNDLIDKAIAKGASLLITVDNGIKCKDNVKYAKDKGLDIIVTDHHLPDLDSIPDCMIYNPHYNTNLPFKDVCGAFVAFMLVFGYYKSNKAIASLEINDIQEFYELAAIATIGDVMPLYNINRLIVKSLVKKINTNRLISLPLNRLIIDAKDISSSTDLAFKIVPILNAPGRIQSAEAAVDFLTGKEFSLDILISLNEKRKKITKESLELLTIDDENINVIYHENLNEGIIGILAGSIKEKTNKPTFVFTNGENGEIKGSGRSVEGFNILIEAEKIIKENDLALGYGGHEGAMGITLKNMESFYSFKKIINDIFKNFKIEPVIPYIKYPNISFEEGSKLLNTLEPFGQGLNIPLFMIEGTPINNRILKEAHTSFSIKNSFRYDFIYFNHIVSNEQRFYFTITESLYNNRITYKGNVKDSK